MMKQTVLAAAGLAICAGTALATSGTVNSGFGIDHQFGPPGGVQFTLGATALTEPTATFRGDRIDANPGTNTTIPDRYTAYCVELGIDLFNPTVSYTAYDLLGGTTSSGGLSGPVTFDAIRTDRLQRLWGTFEASVNSIGSSAAFQLAIWELAFDNDQTLVTGTLFVSGAQFQLGVTDLAESYLSVIRSGGGVSVPLVLLSTNNGGENGADSQDIITTPTPAGASMLALGGLVAMRRRRR